MAKRSGHAVRGGLEVRSERPASIWDASIKTAFGKQFVRGLRSARAGVGLDETADVAVEGHHDSAFAKAHRDQFSVGCFRCRGGCLDHVTPLLWKPRGEIEPAVGVESLLAIVHKTSSKLIAS
jgi:hypothetical protein